jgi:RNA polymerase sigma-70 factor (ECF subfamily)
MAETDADLVGRALAGDQDAFRILADRFASPAFNLILRLVRDRGVAEELAQDALLKAFRGLRSFDPALKLSPWMMRIAHNTAIDYLRRHRPELVSITEDPERPTAHPVLVDERERTPFEHAQQADLRGALDWALTQLRPEYRRLVVLRYQEDQSYDDIASSLSLPLGTVKSHLHRARQTMARLLEGAGWAPGDSGGVKPKPPSVT